VKLNRTQLLGAFVLAIAVLIFLLIRFRAFHQ
jgi:hypothetical protein